jgi:hypothetical protein
VLAFIDEWNKAAHPFAWTPESFDKVLRKVDGCERRTPSLERGSQAGSVVVTNLRVAVLSVYWKHRDELEQSLKQDRRG